MKGKLYQLTSSVPFILSKGSTYSVNSFENDNLTLETGDQSPFLVAR
jgi:hypothetical protein